MLLQLCLAVCVLVRCVCGGIVCLEPADGATVENGCPLFRWSGARPSTYSADWSSIVVVDNATNSVVMNGSVADGVMLFKPNGSLPEANTEYKWYVYGTLCGSFFSCTTWCYPEQVVNGIADSSFENNGWAVTTKSTIVSCPPGPISYRSCANIYETYHAIPMTPLPNITYTIMSPIEGSHFALFGGQCGACFQRLCTYVPPSTSAIYIGGWWNFAYGVYGESGTTFDLILRQQSSNTSTTLISFLTEAIPHCAEVDGSFPFYASVPSVPINSSVCLEYYSSIGTDYTDFFVSGLLISGDAMVAGPCSAFTSEIKCNAVFHDSSVCTSACRWCHEINRCLDITSDCKNMSQNMSERCCNSFNGHRYCRRNNTCGLTSSGPCVNCSSETSTCDEDCIYCEEDGACIDYLWNFTFSGTCGSCVLKTTPNTCNGASKCLWNAAQMECNDDLIKSNYNVFSSLSLWASSNHSIIYSLTKSSGISYALIYGITGGLIVCALTIIIILFLLVYRFRKIIIRNRTNQIPRIPIYSTERSASSIAPIYSTESVQSVCTTSDIPFYSLSSHN